MVAQKLEQKTYKEKKRSVLQSTVTIIAQIKNTTLSKFPY